jgi:hypothetical protein
MFGCVWQCEPEDRQKIKVTPRKKVFKYIQPTGSLGDPVEVDISRTTEGQKWLKIARSWGFPV